jgi:hypothetical protein
MTPPRNWTSRVEKEAVRHHIFDGYHQRHGAIILPGWDEHTLEAGRCIRVGMELAEFVPDRTTIDLSKPLYCVECVPELAKLIEPSMAGLGFTDLRMHPDYLETLRLDTEIDFAFIDLCGSLNPKLLNWIRNDLRPRLVDGAQVATTMLLSARGSDFILSAFYAMMEHYRDIYLEMRETFRVVKPQIIVPMFLLRCALRDLDFDTEVIVYQDTTPMLLIRLLNGEEAEGVSVWPTLEEVLERCSQMAIPRADRAAARRERSNDRSLKQTILDYITNRQIATAEDIRSHAKGYTANQVAFALVELQNAEGKRGPAGGGKLVKVASNPNTYALRDYLVELVA